MTNEELRDAADWHAGRHVARLGTQAAEALTQPSGKVSDLACGNFESALTEQTQAYQFKQGPKGGWLLKVDGWFDLSKCLDAAQLPARPVVKALGQIHAEASMANEVIRLNRDGAGQGRVKVATAMHRIARWAEDALSALEGEGHE